MGKVVGCEGSENLQPSAMSSSMAVQLAQMFEALEELWLGENVPSAKLLNVADLKA